MLLRLLPALLLLAPTALAQADVRALDDGQGGGEAYRFEPARLVMESGETFQVVNEGQEPHTLSHDVERSQRLFDATDIRPGQSRDVRAPREPGEYPFKCAYHPEMRGVLVVRQDAPPVGSTPTEGEPSDPPVGEPGPAAGDDMPAPGLAWIALALVAGALARRR